MGQTDRKYPTMQIAISVEDCAPIGDTERKQLGDIIAVRAPSDGIGKLEAATYLWLNIKGLEENEFADLVKPIFNAAGSIVYDKRRFCIPLERLQRAAAFLDITRAVDTTDIYQPFLNVDGDFPYLFFPRQYSPLDVHGLVFDKDTGRYL